MIPVAPVFNRTKPVIFPLVYPLHDSDLFHGFLRFLQQKFENKHEQSFKKVERLERPKRLKILEILESLERLKLFQKESDYSKKE